MRPYFCIMILLVAWTNEVDMTATLAKPKHEKESNVFDKCSSDFLWRALLATTHGNDSARHFLRSNLAELGFTASGIKARSAAAAWQKQIRHISSKSVFSQLQTFSARQSQNTSCEFQCNDTSTAARESLPNEEAKGTTTTTTTTVQLTTSATPAHTDFGSVKKPRTGIKRIVKLISRLYEQDLPTSIQKKKRKALRRLLKSFLQKQELECGYETTTTTTTTTTTQPPSLTVIPRQVRHKKGKKKRHESENALRVCILMIKELVETGVCEKVEEAFQWTFNEVQNKYVYDVEETFTKAVVVPSRDRNL